MRFTRPPTAPAVLSVPTIRAAHGPITCPPATVAAEVSWPAVDQLLRPRIDAYPTAPVLGSPAWAALDHLDPAKVAAVYAAADQWALDRWLTQHAHQLAGRDVSAAADWPAEARFTAGRASASYIERKTA